MTSPAFPRVSDGLVEVAVLRFPLRVYARAREQHDALMREFALLALDPDGGASAQLPGRLLNLVQQLIADYRASSEPIDELRESALAAGRREIDYSLRLPRAAAASLDVLEAVLTEADEFCRSDRYLLTLASTDEALAFRQWYFGEVRGQLAGRPATPWPGALD